MTYKSYKQRLNIKLGLPQDTEHTLKELKIITASSRTGAALRW